MTETYTLHWDERPFTSNAANNMHHMKRAGLIKKWRDTFHILALEANIPQLENVSIIVSQYAKDRRWISDCFSGCAPTVKASVDGLIDAGVLLDDNPDYVKFVGFNAPVVAGYDSLVLDITGDEVGPALIVPPKVVKIRKPAYNNGRRKSATRSKNPYVRKKPRIP